MLLKKTLFCLMAICFLFLLTGCWDAVDVNNRALVTLVLVDWQDDQYIFYVEVPNLQISQGQDSDGGGGHDMYSIVKAEGASFAEARQLLDRKMEQPVFLGTVRTLLITQDLAQHGLEEYVHRMQADPDYRKALNIITTAEKPDVLLNTKPVKNISIGAAVDQLIHALEQDGKIVTAEVSDVLEYLASETCFVLPDIGLHEGQLVCTGYTAVHEGKKAGYIPFDDAKGLIWIRGIDPKWTYVVEMDAFDATVEVELKNRTITPYFSNEHPLFDLSFEFNAKTMYLSKRVSLDKDKEEQIGKKLEEMLLQDIAKAIEQSQTIGFDYLGLQDRFRINFPNEMKKLDWCEAYLNAEFNISVKTELRPGSLTDFEAIPKARQ